MPWEDAYAAVTGSQKGLVAGAVVPGPEQPCDRNSEVFPACEVSFFVDHEDLAGAGHGDQLPGFPHGQETRRFPVIAVYTPHSTEAFHSSFPSADSA